MRPFKPGYRVIPKRGGLGDRDVGSPYSGFPSFRLGEGLPRRIILRRILGIIPKIWKVRKEDLWG